MFFHFSSKGSHWPNYFSSLKPSLVLYFVKRYILVRYRDFLTQTLHKQQNQVFYGNYFTAVLKNCSLCLFHMLKKLLQDVFCFSTWLISLSWANPMYIDATTHRIPCSHQIYYYFQFLDMIPYVLALQCFSILQLQKLSFTSSVKFSFALVKTSRLEGDVARLWFQSWLVQTSFKCCLSSGLKQG